MGKIILNDIEYGTGISNGVNVDTTNLVEKDSIVTTLDDTVTDEQVPSAKAVYTAIQNVSGGVSTDVYSKTEVDDLLADKADSTDIIDSYTKEEVNNLLNDKVNTDDLVDAYSKEEVNNLLDGKADSSAIVDAYSKTEVDTLLTGKADTDDLVETYSKDEIDGLLADKADSTDIVDAYSKTETDGLLATKADSTALDDKLDKTAIVTSVSSTSTDAQVPSAKSVYNELDTLNGKVTTNTTNIATNTTRIYGIPKRNILINGEFQVNKHKTSIPEGNITTRYVIDRWATNKSGLWISANTITNSAEQKQVNSGHSLKVQVMEGYTGISIYQIIENAKILYTGKTLTMSFWVKGKYAEGKTITARIGSSGSNTGETTVTLTDSWQYVTTTRKECYFGGRDDAGVVITSSDTFDDYSGFEIACVKLELGDTATPFEHIPYAEELLMCQKYHMKIDGVNSNSELGLGHFSAISGTTVYPIVYLPTPLRTEPNKAITPTLTSTVSGLELYGCNSARTAYEVRPVTNLSIYAIKDNLVTFKCETDGEFALGTSGDFRIKRNGSQYSIELDAELY